MVEDLDDLEVGVAGQRQDHVAGAEARVDAAVDERPRRAVPRCAGRCRRGRRVRRRTRGGPGAWPHCASRARDVRTPGSGSLDVESTAVEASAGRPGAAPARTRGAGAPRSAAASSAYAGWPISSISSARVGDVDRLGADVRLGVARAVPVEVVAAGTPAAAVVLADARPRCTSCRRAARPSRKLRRIGSCQHTSGLVSSGLRPCCERQRVQRAAGAGGEVRAVVEDAGRCRRPRRRGSCGSPSSSVSIQSLRRTLPAVRAGTATASASSWSTYAGDPLLVVLVGEVRAEGAAAGVGRRRRRCPGSPGRRCTSSATSARSGRSGRPGRRRRGR